MSRQRAPVEAWFLAPQPVLSVAYLWAGRAGWVEPRLLPLAVAGLFPLVAVVGVGRRLLAADRRWADVAVLAVGLLEIAWATLSMAIAATAAAWRVG